MEIKMIGVIYAGQVELSPFVKRYTSVMDEENIPYEIIHWNRSGEKMPDDDKRHTYFAHVERYGRLIGKTAPFLGFRKFALGIIKEKKYDKLIVLTTQTAVMIPELLLGRYKNRYFFDFRDTSYEYIRLYRNFVNAVIEHSEFTAISSPGFREYLTDRKELIAAHNFRHESYASRVPHCEKRGSGRIVMGYIGYLREYEHLKYLADVFGRDKRFLFNVHGSGDCVDRLREYAGKYPNVEVFGAYDEKEKTNIVSSFDMICYNYPKSFVNYPAVANKFYDGMICKKPVFGNLDTYSGMMIEREGLGISLYEGEKNVTDRIYDYYAGFDAGEFDKNCERTLKSVIAEDEYYMSAIRSFVTDGKGN